MKKSIFFLSVLVFFAFAPQSNAQNDCGDDARSYVNANITTNGIRAITGAKMNVALNKIIDAIICRDSLATILQDSITIEIQQDSILSVTIFGQTVKDTIRNVGGSGGGGVGTPTNGLTTISGNVGLGGNIVQPTTINVDGYQTIFSHGALSAIGFVPNASLREQWLMITGSTDFRIATVNSFRDTTIGNESIGCAINIKDLSGSGKEKGFSNKYSVSTGSHQSYWHYNNPTTSEQLYLSLDDVTGYTITPTGTGLVDPYLGTSIFLVKNTSGNDIFKVAPSGRITEILPAYADDAAAGVAGLTAGDVYQTDGTGAAPLNVAGIRMIKQ